MGVGAAATGSGDAGVARAMGVDQTHYNPAGLPYSPANEAAFGYHVLSLDRVLTYSGVMMQVTELKYWKSPLVNMKLQDPPNPSLYGIMLPPGEYRGGVSRQKNVDDYLNALVDAIQSCLDPEVNLYDAKFTPILQLDGEEYLAPSLREMVRQVAETARKTGIREKEQIKQYIITQYQGRRENPAAIGLSWTHAGTDEIEGRNFDGRKYGTLGFHENRFALSFGLKLNDHVSAGITAGVFYARAGGLFTDRSEALTSTTFGMDLGVQVRPFYSPALPYGLPSLTLGAAIYDLAAKNSWNTEKYWDKGTTKNDLFPKRYRFGIAYAPWQYLSAFVDFETDLDKLLRPKVGIESWVLGANDQLRESQNAKSVSLQGFVLRAGWDIEKPTLGFGLDLRLKGVGSTRLDYAYIIQTVSPEDTQILSWRFRI